MSVGVDGGGQQRVHVDDPAAFTDLEHQGVSGHERVRAGIQRAGAERGHLLVESWAIRETCDFDKLVIPNVATSLSIRRVETPSR